jgi:hypothetical protein
MFSFCQYSHTRSVELSDSPKFDYVQILFIRINIEAKDDTKLLPKNRLELKNIIGEVLPKTWSTSEIRLYEYWDIDRNL